MRFCARRADHQRGCWRLGHRAKDGIARRPAPRYRRGRGASATSGSSSRPTGTGSPGVLRLPADGYRSRLTDYLNSSERVFLALTDVEVTPLDGAPRVEQREFVALSLRHIVLAMPAADGDGRPRLRRPGPAELTLAMATQSEATTPQPTSRGHEPQRDACAPRRACSTTTCWTSSRACIPRFPGPVRARHHVPAGRGPGPWRRLADPGLAARRLPVLDADRVLAAPHRLPLRARGAGSARGCTGSSTGSTTTIPMIRCGW